MSQLELLQDNAFDQQLASHVCPPNWTNPEPSGKYNLVVLGAGTAGLVTAAGAAGLGAKVALIERALMGGDCLNVGCVPSKALIRAARCAAEVRRSAEFGVHLESGAATSAPSPRIDFPAIMERMRKLRAGLSPHDSAARFRELGVDVFLGSGQFLNRDSVTVAGKTLKFQRAVITTGARAVHPEIPGLQAAGFLTNENVFNLTQLPRRLAVIGAGPIGCELAQCFARFGSQVTLIDKYAHLLPREDPDAARILEATLRREGINIVSNAEVRNVLIAESEKILLIQTGELDRPHELRVDAILVGTGRKPNVEGLGLDLAGIDFDARSGVTVNDRLQTTNPKVFAAGDICSPFKFTHAADFMARLVIQNALFYGRGKVSSLQIPWCTYTDPEIAHVGLSEQTAAQQGIAIETYRQSFDKVDRAILDGETEGFVKVHVRKGTDRIVGATIVASHAGEMISEVSMALGCKLGLKRLASIIHPYPTQADAIRKIGDAYNRTRLTPFVKSLFDRWLRWSRS